LGCAPAKAHRATGDRQLVVFAAASLSDALASLARDFENAHAGIDVKLSTAGSQSLRSQIEHGARPQVFASANRAHVDALVSSKLVASPAVFAHNRLALVVPPSNPANIHDLGDLPRANRLVLAGVSVPAGIYTDQMLTRANAIFGSGFAERVRKRVVSREMHVRLALQKVVLAEADAAVVYETDAQAAGKAVVRIPIPERCNVVASYLIAPVVAAPNGAHRQSLQLGKQLVAFVRSDAAREKLRAFGFLSCFPGAAGCQQR